MSKFCPVCGSTEFKTVTNKNSLPIAYGEPAIVEETTDTCLSCGVSGDFSDENDLRVTTALAEAKKKSIDAMLETLSEMGIKMAYLERALELPARTVSRWKSGESSAASLALLRAIRTYPWILEVADARFDPYIAKMKLVEGAAQVLREALVINAKSASLVVNYDMDELNFSGNLVLDPAYQSLDLLKPMMTYLTSNGD
jgi:transcriptional regulator with XRE-family HTH domain